MENLIHSSDFYRVSEVYLHCLRFTPPTVSSPPMRKDVSLDPKATHFCPHCGLTMKPDESLECSVRDGDLCEAREVRRGSPQRKRTFRREPELSPKEFAGLLKKLDEPKPKAPKVTTSGWRVRPRGGGPWLYLDKLSEMVETMEAAEENAAFEVERVAEMPTDMGEFNGW